MKLTGRTARRTLSWVNLLRAEYGRKPLKKIPKGVPDDPQDCPIARALHASSVVSGEVRMNGERIPTPKYVDQFVASFDSYRIPELIDE